MTLRVTLFHVGDVDIIHDSQWCLADTDGGRNAHIPHDVSVTLPFMVICPICFT